MAERQKELRKQAKQNADARYAGAAESSTGESSGGDQGRGDYHVRLQKNWRAGRAEREYADARATGALPAGLDLAHAWPFVLVQGLAFATLGYVLRGCSDRRGRRRRPAAVASSWGGAGRGAHL